PVGWAWVPGTEYAPAHVMWRRGDARIGWAPVPPKFKYEEPATPPADWWVFVKARNFVKDSILTYNENNLRYYWYYRLPLVFSLRYFNGLPYYAGPRWS